MLGLVWLLVVFGLVWLPSCVAPAAALSRANPLLVLFEVSEELVVVDVVLVVEVVFDEVGELLLVEVDGAALLELFPVIVESVADDPAAVGVEADAEAPIPLVLAEPLMDAEGPEAPVH